MTRQISELSSGKTEKILDISLIDRDMEKLAGKFNQYYSKQRYQVACALQHEEHLKESIANISHDLRTPLTVIMGHLQLLQKSDLHEAEKHRVEIAMHKSERMKELIETFYDLAILDTDDIQPQIEKINISNLVINFLSENAPMLESRKIQPDIRLPEESVFILSDRNMLERILQNLLTNAVRYSDGKISIELDAFQNSKACIQISNSVHDAGSIKAERLFERFYIGDKSRHSESTGLGLAVVKSLVEKLDGSISAIVNDGSLCIELLL
ncbi:sensor protein kinase WalK [Clostridium oryzae]|uniref:histidine kinase n=1 Tax=Clostridium oryzae TaxID=1450648 RepID=A0A1V4IJ38_9CLOT|nr:sensor protein kinase WalK [Clostridium oryzae]